MVVPGKTFRAIVVTQREFGAHRKGRGKPAVDVEVSLIR